MIHQVVDVRFSVDEGPDGNAVLIILGTDGITGEPLQAYVVVNLETGEKRWFWGREEIIGGFDSAAQIQESYEGLNDDAIELTLHFDSSWFD
jgi:hypothetical protein